MRALRVLHLQISALSCESPVVHFVSLFFKASQFLDTLDLHYPPMFLILEGETFSLGAGKITVKQHDNPFLSLSSISILLE